jgi:cytochrome c553
MGEIATRLSDEDMRPISDFEGLPPREPEGSAADGSIAGGRTIATGGVPERDIRACAECHGPTTLPKNPAYPKLSAQHVRYLVWQLRLLQERRRGETANVNLMSS